MNEKHSIYEIYRACRLCGAGAGYKMPIMQSVIGIHAEDFELKLKIKECVQIEVNYNDRMPPLICELCVDKVNDFYEFRKMCIDTNRKTRLRLGLPLEAAPQKTLDAEQRKLNERETVIVDSDSDEGAPLVQQPAPRVNSKPKPKCKKECNVKIKVESNQSKEKLRSPSPEVMERRELRDRTRLGQTRHSSDVSLSELQNDILPFASKAKKKFRELSEEISPPAKKLKLSEPVKLDRPAKAGPKSSKALPPPPQQPKAGPKSKKAEPVPVSQGKVNFATKGKKSDAPAPKSKRPEPPPPPPPPPPLAAPRPKKPELTPTPISKAKNRDALTPVSKSRKREATPPSSSRAAPPPPRSYSCAVCGNNSFKTSQGLASHLKVHTPTFTPKALACNACELWFSAAPEATSHHRFHKKSLPYTCNKCYDDFRTEQDYDLHFSRSQCVATYEAPDVKCEECWRVFPTYKLLEEHRCPGAGARPGGKCAKCSRPYTLMRYLVAHEMKCTARGKAVPKVDPEVSSRMLPMQVRIVKCDSLLKNARNGHYDISNISHRFGLDRESSYPYFYSMGDNYIKSEPAISEFGHMVDIQDEIKKEYLNSDDSDAPWDSDGSEGSEDRPPGLLDLFKKKAVDTLSTMSLKAIFSPKFLGEVPRKKRKRKSVKTFDSILSIGFHGFSIKRDIDNIIDNLGNESLLGDNFDSNCILDEKSGAAVDSLKAVIDSKETSSATEVNESNEQDENIVIHTHSAAVDSLKAVIDSKETSSATEVNESNEQDENIVIHTHSAAVDSLKAVIDSKETSSATEVNESNEQGKGGDKIDDASDRISSKVEDSDVLSDAKDQNKRVCNRVGNTSEVTNATNANNQELDEVAKSNQQSSAASDTTEHYNHASDSTIALTTNFSDNVIKDYNKNGHLITKNIVHEKESLAVEDKVENSTTQEEESETMEVVNNEPLSIEGKVENSIAELKESDIINDYVQTELKSDETNKEIVNGEGIDLVPTENKETEASNIRNENPLPYNYTNDDTNTEDDSQSSLVIDYKTIDDPNDEKDDSQSTIVNDKMNLDNDTTDTTFSIPKSESNDRISDKNETRASSTISFSDVFKDNDTKTDDPNVEKDDSQSSVINDKMNLDNDTTDTTFSIPKSESNDRISDKNDTRASSTISFSDSVFINNDIVTKRIESDKFNINDLNEADKRLMEELDAQIGEEPTNDVIDDDGRRIDEKTTNDIISECKVGDNTALVGENIDKNDIISVSNVEIGGNAASTSENAVSTSENLAGIGENIDKNDINSVNNVEIGENTTSTSENLAGTGENEGPNEVFEGNASSLVISDNIGFEVASDDKKEKLLNDLILKSNDDLRSLELDTISDEEFNFDL